MSLASLRPLGRSGLLVSPLALGTMTFGTERWGSDADTSRAIFERYVALGGNFIDTADVYAAGRSEEMVGAFIAEAGLRDAMVIATKAGFSAGPGAHAGGNGARHLHAAVDGSLRRLRTDHIDLFWVHVWDGITPATELLQTLGDLVQSGKIRYYGLSNVPAWYAAELATAARHTGRPGPIALQYAYSLVDRTVEAEHVPMGLNFGMGLVPWSPLAYGLLTGKYDRSNAAAGRAQSSGVPNRAAADGAVRPAGDKRLDGENPFGDTLFTERNWQIVDRLVEIATQAGQTPARMALAWVTQRPGVASTLMGVSRPEQLDDNARVLDMVLSPDDADALSAVSRQDTAIVYGLQQPALRNTVVFGGADVRSTLTSQ